MGFLSEIPEWVNDIFKIETDTVWKGGDDGDANKQGIALAKRTQWLKQAIESISGDLADHLESTNPHSQYLSIAGAQKNQARTAQAGGSADAITATFDPAIVAPVDGMLLYVRAGAANTIPEPTFTPAPGSVDPAPIVKLSGAALVPGDIAGAGHRLALVWDAAASKWALLNPATGNSETVSAGAVQGAYKNLKLSASGTSANISISADALVLENAADAHKTLRGLALTLNSAAAGVNGLDTGALSGSTWYSVWVIAKADGTAAALMSASETTPTLPAGYTFKARVGWIRTDATVNKYPWPFRQRGRAVQWRPVSGAAVDKLITMASGVAGDVTVPNWTSVSLSGFVPPTAGVLIFGVSIDYTGRAMVAPSNIYGAYTDTANPPPFSTPYAAGSRGVYQGQLVLDSNSIYWCSENAGNRLLCIGYEDNL